MLQVYPQPLLNTCRGFPGLYQPRAQPAIYLSLPQSVGVFLQLLSVILPVLRHHLFMPMATTPLVDPPQSSTQTLSGGLGLDNPFPPTRLAPVVGKA